MGDEFIQNEEKSWFHTIPAQMTILKDFFLFTKMKLFLILKLVLFSLKPRINGDSVKMQTGIIVCKWTVYFTGFYDKYKLHPSVVVVTYLHLRQKWMSKPRTTETAGDSFIHSTKIYWALSLFLALAICWEKQQCLWHRLCSCWDSGLRSCRGSHAKLDCFQKHKSYDLLFSLLRKTAL